SPSTISPSRRSSASRTCPRATRNEGAIETVLVGNRSLLTEGVARILRSENFRIVASVSCADDFLSKVHSHPLLFLFIHTGDNFDVTARQVELLRGSTPSARIVVVADRYRLEE